MEHRKVTTPPPVEGIPISTPSAPSPAPSTTTAPPQAAQTALKVVSGVAEATSRLTNAGVSLIDKMRHNMGGQSGD